VEDGDIETAASEPIVIDCDTCLARCSAACADCVVTFICRDDTGDGERAARGASAPGLGRNAVVIDVAEFRALRLLHERGLVPRLRHQRGA
jgi:hypothetical protein